MVGLAACEPRGHRFKRWPLHIAWCVGKTSEKEQEKPSTPTIDILAELSERLRIDREIRVHNYRNARRRILRREFEESEAKAIKTKPITKMEW